MQRAPYTQSHVSACIEWCGGGWLLKAKLWQPFCWWGCSSFDNREGVATARASVSDRTRKRERAEGEGRRVSDTGIRQLGQAAWLEADFIVHLSFPSPSDTLCWRSRERLTLTTGHLQPLTNCCQAFSHFPIRVHADLCKTNNWRKEDFLDSASLQYFKFCICNGAGVAMVVYLRKSIHSLLSVFKKKGECWLTWRSSAGCSFDFRLLTWWINN